MIESHIRKNASGEPVWTLRVTGPHDMWRVAWHLVRAQSEMQPHGRKVYRYIYRLLGRARFVYLDNALDNGEVMKAGWHKRMARDW